MAIVFAVRGDSLDARYSNNGKTPGLTGPTLPVVNSTVAGINGSTSIDMANAAQCVANWQGNTNYSSNKGVSVLLRFQLPALVNRPLFHIGIIGRTAQFGMGVHVRTAGDPRAFVYDLSGTAQNILGAGAPIGAGVWHDYLFTFTGDTTASGFEHFVDAVSAASATSSVSYPSPFDAAARRAFASIMLGAEENFSDTNMYVDEFVIWDEVIDPTSVTLTSGSGSLNGASRTAYVDVEALDGAAGGGGGSVIGASRLGAKGFNK